MKSRFWICIVLMLIGAGWAGYQSGRSNGEQQTRVEAQQFLKEFARSTGLETYFQERGEPQRALELTAFEPLAVGVHSHGPSSLVGLVCFAVGTFGLLPLARRQSEKPV